LCTVLVDSRPRRHRSILIAAVRDEFADRPWEPPERHWPDRDLIGGRDLRAGGTWLAVAPDRRELAIVVNGPGEADHTGTAQTRGVVPLLVLDGREPSRQDLLGLPGFHLLHASPGHVRLLSWTGGSLTQQEIPPGRHMITHGGLDDDSHPRVRRFRPLLANLVPEEPWHDWKNLLTGLGLDPAGRDALVVDRIEAGSRYRTGSAALIELSEGQLRYEFTADPRDPGSWRPVAA
jgi:uncharacterized protein with NRDE domain